MVAYRERVVQQDTMTGCEYRDEYKLLSRCRHRILQIQLDYASINEVQPSSRSAQTVTIIIARNYFM